MRPAAVHPFSGSDLTTLLEDRARLRGEHPFLIWAPFEAPSETWSYARFADAAARLAGGLSRRGVRSGDRVMVHLENCPEALLARFACARLGALCVSTNANATGAEIDGYAVSSGATVAITQPRFASLLDRHCKGLRWIAVTATDAGNPPGAGAVPPRSEGFAALLGDPAPRRAPAPEEFASIMFTTGTTARPKGVLWTQANALWGARLGALQQALRADDIYHVFLPIYHVVGLSWSLLPALWAGATVLLQPRFSASRYWEAALAHRATVGSQVVFTTRVLSQQPVPERHGFRQWTDANSQEAHEALFRMRIVGGWGMTEVVAQGIVGDPWSRQRSGSIGRPSAAYEVRILGDGGRAVAPGETGQLMIRGVPGLSLFAGYDGDANATAEAFDDEGFFRTGDRVTLHEDGWIEFADRARDVIKVGGEGVSAAEVEAVILSVPGVREAAVVARPDATWGEVAVAFVVAEQQPAQTLADAILERCRASLAKFKVPREVRFIDALPRVGFGKVAKARLREQLKDA